MAKFPSLPLRLRLLELSLRFFDAASFEIDEAGLTSLSDVR